MFMKAKTEMSRCVLGQAAFALILFASMADGFPVRAQGSAKPDAPQVTKVEPPNWWIGLTPEVMLLLSGHHLDATHVSCNLSTVIVSRTQSSAGGSYLFVWLKIGADTRSGTAICRITTPIGLTSFELPLAS